MESYATSETLKCALQLGDPNRSSGELPMAIAMSVVFGNTCRMFSISADGSIATATAVSLAVNAELRESALVRAGNQQRRRRKKSRPMLQNETRRRGAQCDSQVEVDFVKMGVEVIE